jgi:acyl carrier protein
VADVLVELQDLVAAYYGDPDMDIDPDWLIKDVGMDSVGLNDLVASVESKFQIDLSAIADENGNFLTVAGNLKEQTLRQFAQNITQFLSERPQP